MDKFLWNLMRILSFPKILYFKILWLNIWLWSKSNFFWWPKFRYHKLIKIGENFQLWRYSRMTGNIEIWNNVFLNEFTSINAGVSIESKITLWDDVMFGPWCFLQSGDHSFKKWELYRLAEWWKSKPIIIGNNVWIWAKSIILKWVKIWDNSVIWAGSVVTKNIPPNVVAVWNPAKVIKEII